jgi:predicted alpha/beta hydrolase family esterase
MLGLSIILTKITTEIDQAADIFYVIGPDNSKIFDFEHMDRIRSELQAHLTAMEDAHFNSQRIGMSS